MPQRDDRFYPISTRPVEVPVSATVAVLRDHRHRMRQERLLVGADFNDLGLVFHQPDGSWLHPEAVSEAFLRRVRRYGLPRLTLHGLRHTWATLAQVSDVAEEASFDMVCDRCPIREKGFSLFAAVS